MYLICFKYINMMKCLFLVFLNNNNNTLFVFADAVVASEPLPDAVALQTASLLILLLL